MLARHRLCWAQYSWGTLLQWDIRGGAVSSVEDDETQTLSWRRHDTATLQSCSSHAELGCWGFVPAHQYTVLLLWQTTALLHYTILKHYIFIYVSQQTHSCFRDCLQKGYDSQQRKRNISHSLHQFFNFTKICQASKIFWQDRVDPFEFVCNQSLHFP